MRRLETSPWWPDLVAKKDSMSLRELQEMFGATPDAIVKALRRCGLSRTAARSGPRPQSGARHINLFLAESTLAWLDAFSAARGSSRSATIREALDEYRVVRGGGR